MNIAAVETSKKVATRDAFGDALSLLGKEIDNLFVIDCDIGKSTKTGNFAVSFPERYINVGIAEQNAAGIAAGLAAQGKIPIISTYAVFGSMRMLEQIRTSICYPNLHVILACSHAGLTPGSDGVTHQAIEDMGIYRTIPNMTVIMPPDYHSAKSLIKEAVYYQGPVYVRLTRDPVPTIYDEKDNFKIGLGKLIKEGSDLTIITIGDMLIQSLRASKILSDYNIDVEIIDIQTLKPLDRNLISSSLKKTKKIITVEDHNIMGGLGSAVCEISSELGLGQVVRLGLQDTFAESGPYEKLLQKYELDAAAIVKAAREIAGK